MSKRKVKIKNNKINKNIFIVLGIIIAIVLIFVATKYFILSPNLAPSKSLILQDSLPDCSDVDVYNPVGSCRPASGNYMCNSTISYQGRLREGLPTLNGIPGDLRCMTINNNSLIFICTQNLSNPAAGFKWELATSTLTSGGLYANFDVGTTTGICGLNERCYEYNSLPTLSDGACITKAYCGDNKIGALCDEFKSTCISGSHGNNDDYYRCIQHPLKVYPYIACKQKSSCPQPDRNNCYQSSDGIECKRENNMSNGFFGTGIKFS